MKALNNLKISDLYGGVISENAHLSNIVPLNPPSKAERQLTLGVDETKEETFLQRRKGIE